MSDVKPVLIEPTPGRVVHYYPGHDRSAPPLAAHVAKVIDHRTVNLMVISAIGMPFPVLGVQLLQEDDVPPPRATAGDYAHDMPHQKGHASWMPYQKKVVAGEIEPTQHARGKRVPGEPS
jgi:hypothetical protein